jgi:O-antigen/teichoic acid export membrane protein
MLGILGEASRVGVYNAASRTATLVTFVLMAVNSIAAPKISSLYAEGKREELQELAASVAHYIFWPSVGIAIGIVLLSSYILGLFGSEFVAAQGVLAVLACGQVINAGAGSVGYFMNMTGHQDQSAWVFGTTAVINIVLNGVGIPLLGVKGAAIATAISMAIWNVWLNSLVVRNLGIHASVIGVIRK